MSKNIKRVNYLLGATILFLMVTVQGFANTTISPFSGIKSKVSVEDIKSTIKNQGFQVIGEYNVAGNKNNTVIAFTRNDLKKVAASYNDRGALASVLKIGVNKSNDGNVEVSLANPNYMFNAYFGAGYDKNKTILNKIDSDAHKILAKYGEVYQFGGDMKISKIRKYQYKMMMPYFTDPAKLEKYNSFEDGLAVIEKNIKTNKDVHLVYKVVDKEKKTAVYGFGLTNKKTGEASFMPTIGMRNLAAMPYEVILQGNTVTMLEGKYRIALYWPTLSMGTFMKIVSTPGNIEDTLESVVKSK